jgi:APA family basic amino acid/polyamine antiporter
VFSDSLGYFFKFPRFSAALEGIALHIPWIGEITPFKFIGLKLTTIALILFLTLINYLGVKLGSAVQVAVTALKVFSVLAIVVFAFAVGHGNLGNFTQNTGSFQAMSGPGIFIAFIVAMSGAFWAYDGWINVTYLAGEVKDATRNLPKAMFIAALVFIS